MSVNEDYCVKRIVKAFLHFKGEASTDMLAKHILNVGYGLRKTYSTRALGHKLPSWSKGSQWFRVVSFKKNDETWWRLE